MTRDRDQEMNDRILVYLCVVAICAEVHMSDGRRVLVKVEGRSHEGVVPVLPVLFVD